MNAFEVKTAIVTAGILVSGICAHAQSYSPILAPQSSNSGTWQCLDQYDHPIPYAYFQFSNGVYFYSNAHYHGPVGTEPVSTSTPSSGYADSSGNFSVTLTTTKVGQEEYQATSCSINGYTAYGNQDFAVGYGDVYYTDQPIWVKIGGSDTGGGTNHGTTAYNHYLTTSAAYDLYYASEDYLTANPSITQLCTNDMALYIGGKFDICNTLGLCTNSDGSPKVVPWTSPHSQHDRGTAADVAATGTGQCTNAGGSGVNVAQFINDCLNHGGYMAYSFNEGNHAHCGFSIPTWPH
jgi:hypothetical protein